MPDLELLCRDLELHLSRNDPVKRAYVQGKHDGMDKARREIAIIATTVIVIASILVAFASTM